MRPLVYLNASSHAGQGISSGTLGLGAKAWVDLVDLLVSLSRRLGGTHLHLVWAWLTTVWGHWCLLQGTNRWEMHAVVVACGVAVGAVPDLLWWSDVHAVHATGELGELISLALVAARVPRATAWVFAHWVVRLLASRVRRVLRMLRWSRRDWTLLEHVGALVVEALPDSGMEWRKLWTTHRASHWHVEVRTSGRRDRLPAQWGAISGVIAHWEAEAGMIVRLLIVLPKITRASVAWWSVVRRRRLVWLWRVVTVHRLPVGEGRSTWVHHLGRRWGASWVVVVAIHRSHLVDRHGVDVSPVADMPSGWWTLLEMLLLKRLHWASVLTAEDGLAISGIRSSAAGVRETVRWDLLISVDSLRVLAQVVEPGEPAATVALEWPFAGVLPSQN